MSSCHQLDFLAGVCCIVRKTYRENKKINIKTESILDNHLSKCLNDFARNKDGF